MRLRVEKIEDEHAWSDRVLIPIVHRSGIKSGSICKLTTSQGRSKLVQVFSPSERTEEPIVLMDYTTRNYLGLQKGSQDEFRLRPAKFFGQSIWALKSVDPTVRIAAQLGALSVALGILSIVFAIFPPATIRDAIDSVFHHPRISFSN